MPSNIQQILISNTSFIPSILQIVPGTTVKWVVTNEKESNSNSDFYDEVRAHVIEINELEYESTYLKQNESCSLCFEKEGIYNFSCGIVGTKGKIIVKKQEIAEEPILHSIKYECKNILSIMEKGAVATDSRSEDESEENREKENSMKKNNKRRNKDKRKRVRKTIGTFLKDLWTNCAEKGAGWVETENIKMNSIFEYISENWAQGD
jgi:plastocyanin